MVREIRELDILGRMDLKWLCFAVGRIDRDGILISFRAPAQLDIEGWS